MELLLHIQVEASRSVLDYNLEDVLLETQDLSHRTTVVLHDLTHSSEREKERKREREKERKREREKERERERERDSLSLLRSKI